jgi:hypothetical protein
LRRSGWRKKPAQAVDLVPLRIRKVRELIDRGGDGGAIRPADRPGSALFDGKRVQFGKGAHGRRPRRFQSRERLLGLYPAFRMGRSALGNRRFGRDKLGLEGLLALAAARQQIIEPGRKGGVGGRIWLDRDRFGGRLLLLDRPGQ